jgi:hypothetical protein
LQTEHFLLQIFSCSQTLWYILLFKYAEIFIQLGLTVLHSFDQFWYLILHYTFIFTTTFNNTNGAYQMPIILNVKHSWQPFQPYPDIPINQLQRQGHNKRGIHKLRNYVTQFWKIFDLLPLSLSPGVTPSQIPSHPSLHYIIYEQPKELSSRYNLQNYLTELKELHSSVTLHHFLLIMWLQK